MNTLVIRCLESSETGPILWTLALQDPRPWLCIPADSGRNPAEPGKKGPAGKIGRFWNTGMRHNTFVAIRVHSGWHRRKGPNLRKVIKNSPNVGTWKHFQLGSSVDMLMDRKRTQQPTINRSGKGDGRLGQDQQGSSWQRLAILIGSWQQCRNACINGPTVICEDCWDSGVKWVWKERKWATEWYRSYPQEGAAKIMDWGLTKSDSFTCWRTPRRGG
jgi:hypothetical protein